MLQNVMKELPDEVARYHLKRCIDSGLWVPGGSSDSAEENSKPTSDETEEIA